MDSSSRYLLKSFRKYYRANTLPMPDRFTRREFGFMMFDRNFMIRQLSFSNQQELQKYMATQAPRHSYYSTAYYRKPDAPTMEEKEWMGAELIFDLDADHLEGAENMSFEDMLAQIKKEMIGLVDSFLFGDMGFTERSRIPCSCEAPGCAVIRIAREKGDRRLHHIQRSEHRLDLPHGTCSDGIRPCERTYDP